MNLTKNAIVEGEITGYASDGMGVCRLEGQVVFVAQGVRGDKCRLRVVKALKNKAYARMEALLEPSPHRQTPACPVFPKCGGCDFWHMRYEEELFYKRRRVMDALERLAGVPLPQLEITGGCRQSYRNKAIYPCAMGEKGPVAGFYRSRSHQVVSCRRCAIQAPQADALRQAVLDWAAHWDVSIYDEQTGRGLLRRIYVRTGQGGALLTLVIAGTTIPQAEDLLSRCRQACPELAGLLLNENRDRGNRALGPQCRLLWGQDRLTDSLCGVEFSLSPLSFYQVNRRQAEALYRQAADYAGGGPEEILLDLYCGAGTIGLAMARQFSRLIGVEIVPQAVEDAKENARRNGVSNAQFLCADAGQAAQRLLQEGLRPHAIVVDPPRKGLDRSARQAVLALAPERLVYVSCDPATMARDIKELTQGGYRLTQARAFDLFPCTANVETVCQLTR